MDFGAGVKFGLFLFVYSCLGRSLMLFVFVMFLCRAPSIGQNVQQPHADKPIDGLSAYNLFCTV